MKILIIYLLLIPNILFALDCPEWEIGGFKLGPGQCISSGGTAYVYLHPRNQQRIFKVFGVGYKEIFVDEVKFSDVLLKERIPVLKALSHTNLNTNENNLGNSSWYIEKVKLQSAFSDYCKSEQMFQRIPNLKGFVDIISKIKLANYKSLQANKRRPNDPLKGKLIIDWHIENFMHDKNNNWYLIDFLIYDINEFLSLNNIKGYDFSREIQREIFELCPVSKAKLRHLL